MNIEKINKDIKQFSKDREWDKFHNPKNLVMALSVESSELLEIYQWLNEKDALDIKGEKLTHVKEEIADIAIYLLRVCMSYDINLEDAINSKMKKNALKYPILDEDGNKIDYSKKF